MAIRHRKGRASPWQCYWNNPLTGKRECANFITRAEAEKHDSLVKHRIKFERESFRKEDVEEKEEPSMTLEMCYLHYLRQKKFNKKGLAWQMDARRTPLQMFGGMAIADIQHEHIVCAMEAMQKQNVKPVTVRGRMSVFRTVMRWSAEQDFCNPVRFPKLPPANYERFIPPTPDELAAIIRVAAPHIVRVIILGAQCGVRVGPSEMFRLTWDDVDLTRRVLRVHGAKKNMAAPWREVPIRESLLPVFEQWRQEDAMISASHLIHYNRKPIMDIKTAWRSTLERSGVQRNIRPYDLRHAFATEAIAAGVDVGTVANLMGHSSPTMIFKHYQHVLSKQKRAAVESLPDIQYVPKTMCPKTKAPADNQQVLDFMERETGFEPATFSLGS